jgi:type II secretory pathway pseudopilin PulG
MTVKPFLLLIAGVVIGVSLSQMIQSLIEAGHASKAKRSRGSALLLSNALERYRSEHGSYPPLAGDDMAASLVPHYLRAVPTDVDGRPYYVVMNGSTAAVVCVGRGGFIIQRGTFVSETHNRPYPINVAAIEYRRRLR